MRGCSLSYAFGAAFDNPGLIVSCVVGDGEAETGPSATSWHSNKFLNPIVDSMVNQHAKWLKVSDQLTWRKSIASLTYLLSSHVWRQDHNDFSHQDPGFIDHVMNKKAEVVWVYLPPDARPARYSRRKGRPEPLCCRALLVSLLRGEFREVRPGGVREFGPVGR